MSGIEENTEDVEIVREKVEDLKTRYGFREPDRGNFEDENIEWRHEKPDYTKANYQYLKGKTQNHAEGAFTIQFNCHTQLTIKSNSSHSSHSFVGK